MDAKKFGEILSMAIARITREDGSIIDPAKLPEGSNPAAVENLEIAWALVQSTQTIGTIARTVLAAGLGEKAGSLESAVALLGAQRDRLRQLADVGAKEIQCLTMQRDAARRGVEALLAAFQAGDLAIEHAGIVRVSERGHHHTTACPADDTCQCPGRMALLKARLALAVTKSTDLAERIAGMQAGMRTTAMIIEASERAANDPTPDVTVQPCQKCGHQHAGPELASICVGCPCPGVGATVVEVHADDPTPTSGLQGFDPADIVVGGGGETLADVAEDHDHVFIDGRCACGESVQ